MKIPPRVSAKVLLLNPQNKLLLLYTHDPKTKSVNSEYEGSFWSVPGGGVEAGETLREAALREVYEETGIALEEGELGPPVWWGEFDLILNGEFTHIKQTFFVAKIKQSNFSLSNLTALEKKMVRKLAWFSLEDLQNSDEIIYPVILLEHLPSILAGHHPELPLEVDLAKLPRRCANRKNEKDRPSVLR